MIARVGIVSVSANRGTLKRMSSYATQDARDEAYRRLITDALATCRDYQPKFGKTKPQSKQDFLNTYGADPLYHWVGFDSPTLYAAHKAAGAMTSIYRQLGIGVERLFRHILMDEYVLTEEQANWQYDYVKPNGKTATRYMDGRIDRKMVEANVEAGILPKSKLDDLDEWLKTASTIMKVNGLINGVVFEVREGYKSADSKRQNGDIDNKDNIEQMGGYLSSMALISSQINETVRKRYQNNGVLLLSGELSSNDAHKSIYAFMDQVVGYDWKGFFDRNSPIIRTETQKTFDVLLNTD